MNPEALTSTQAKHDQCDLSLIPTTYGVGCFLISIALFGYYQNGDQIGYRKFYAMVTEMGLVDSVLLSGATIGSLEPIYAIFSALFASFVDKDILFSIVNGFLGFLISKWMVQKNVSKIIIFATLFNFYLLVLFFSAERLKLALLILMLGESFISQSWLFYLFGILTQVTVFLLVMTKIFAKIFGNKIFYKKQFNIKIVSIQILAFIGVGVILYRLLGEHILNKFQAYGVGDDLSTFGAIKVLSLVWLSCLYAESRIQPFLAGLPILVASILMGPDRTVIFAYILFMYYALQYRRGLNLGVIGTSVYFGIKGISFILNIISYGDGFNSMTLN